MPAAPLNPLHPSWPLVEKTWEMHQEGRTQVAIARHMRRPRGTIQNWLNAYEDWLATGGVTPEAPGPEVEVAPEERHDSNFWRKKASALEKERDALSSLAREIGGVDGIRLRAPEWMFQGDGPRKGRATLIVHNSDRHYAEVIDPDEVQGWNGYDIETCERRVNTFMEAACALGPRWMADTNCDGVLYTMGGDEISGDIHEELILTNEITSLDAIQGASELHVACLNMLLDVFPKIHVAAVPGNHGRTTKKPTAKKYGALSYDIMIAKLVAREFADDERVSFDIAAGPDVMTDIYDWQVLTTHGDKIGTGGGQGFAGPVLPIIRGGTKMTLQYGRAGLQPDLILMGHYHTSANPPGILANGSVPGVSEYGFGIRGSIEPPKQWLGVIRSRWGLAERLDVQLEEPIPR